MKKIIFSTLPIAAIAAITLFPNNDPLPIGATIPKAEQKMKDVSGNMVSFNDTKMKNGLLVMFSCNTCPYVIKNQERTNEICNYALTNSVGVIILNSNEAYRKNEDSYAAMKEYAADQKYKWHYVVDENSVMADEFGANRTPECFLFDNAGKLVYHGAIDDNPSNESAVTRKHLASAIAEMKSGKDVAIKESKSVGCSIKRNK